MKKPVVRVSDHAVVRWLERVQGMDIEAVRTEIGRRVDLAREHPGASGVISGGFIYKLQGEVVTTVTPQTRKDLRTGGTARKGFLDDG